jgi:hypothetical protein
LNLWCYFEEIIWNHITYRNIASVSLYCVINISFPWSRSQSEDLTAYITDEATQKYNQERKVWKRPRWSIYIPELNMGIGKQNALDLTQLCLKAGTISTAIIPPWMRSALGAFCFPAHSTIPADWAGVLGFRQNSEAQKHRHLNTTLRQDTVRLSCCE